MGVRHAAALRLNGSEYGWQRCGHWTARRRCRPGIGNTIAVMSRANIKNGDFITVIWRRRGAGIVDNTYCQVLFSGNYQVMRRGSGREKGHPRCPSHCSQQRCSDDAAGFLERQARRARTHFVRIAITEAADEIGFHSGAGKESGIQFAGIETRHWAAIEAQRARRQN